MANLSAVDLARMERILLAFHRSTGLDAIVVDAEGRPVAQPAQGRQASFCRLIRSTPSGDEACCRCYARAADTAAELGEPYYFRCHAGLVCWAAPILGGPGPTAVVCNQVLMWEPDDLFWSEVAEATGLTREDCEPLMEAALELERVEPLRVQAAAEVLMAIANALSPRPAAGEGLRAPASPQQGLYRQETRIAAAMEAVALAVPAPQRLLERENLLLHRIRLRDSEGAATVLNDLLADLCLTPEQARARVLELLALMSRAVIEAGGEGQAVLDASTAYVEQANGAPDVEAACAVARAALNHFMSMLRPTAGGARHQLLLRVMAYLRDNYHRQDLSLARIARVVHLSPAYLSHLFSKELNMTMTQYLTSVRLEAAKLSLRDTDIPVSELAMEVGYVDSGYFCKTFKKYLKTSPGAYRQKFRARSQAGEHQKTAP